MNRLKEEWPQNILKDAGIEEASDKNIKMLEKTLEFANDRQNEMVEMYYKDGMSYKTIGLHYDISPTSVKSSIDRVIGRIKTMYQEQRTLEEYCDNPKEMPVMHSTMSVKLQNTLLRYLSNPPGYFWEPKRKKSWESIKIKDILELTSNELLNIYNLGPAAIRELIDYLKSIGIENPWKDLYSKEPRSLRVRIFWGDLSVRKKQEIRELFKLIDLNADVEGCSFVIPISVIELREKKSDAESLIQKE